MRQCQLAISALSVEWRHAHHGWLRVLRFKVGGDGGVIGQHHTILCSQRWHGALGVDVAVGIAKLFT